MKIIGFLILSSDHQIRRVREVYSNREKRTLLKRLMILPRGVDSKNLSGALSTDANSRLCTFWEATYAPKVTIVNATPLKIAGRLRLIENLTHISSFPEHRRPGRASPRTSSHSCPHPRPNSRATMPTTSQISRKSKRKYSIQQNIYPKKRDEIQHNTKITEFFRVQIVHMTRHLEYFMKTKQFTRPTSSFSSSISLLNVGISEVVTARARFSTDARERFESLES